MAPHGPEEHAYSDGEVITAQGAAATELHTIVSGTVAVVVNGREVAQRGIGDVVAEMALISTNRAGHPLRLGVMSASSRSGSGSSPGSFASVPRRAWP